MRRYRRTERRRLAAYARIGVDPLVASDQDLDAAEDRAQSQAAGFEGVRSYLIRDTGQRSALALGTDQVCERASLTCSTISARSGCDSRSIGFSPLANLLALTGGLGELTEDEFIDLLRQVVPMIASDRATDIHSVLDSYQRLRRKRQRTRDEILLLERVRRKFRESRGELGAAAEGILERAGAGELEPAIEQGLLEIEPLITGDEFDIEEMLRTFVDRLADVLAGQRMYPLFDDATGDLLSAHIAKGLFNPSPGAVDRGKQVGAASHFLSQLPAFPKATVSEVLDIRSDLREPLVRFRAAVVEIGERIRTGAPGSEFRDEVQDIYVRQVLPALQEIEELTRDNAYMKVLLGEVLMDGKTILTGLIAMGVARSVDVPELAAAGVASAVAAAKAGFAKHQQQKQISRHQFYFLYRTDHLLSR
jgi:hypothetical protein